MQVFPYYDLNKRGQEYARHYHWKTILQTVIPELSINVKELRALGLLEGYTMERLADVALRMSNWTFNEHGERIA